ncbi:FixH family protein [Roseixanthobacter liquoris]|uniref:FixH family protein n=1 Tax=Roseixanthobacter liquoris TaxID=3119921 RepID=UPI00372CB5AF
MAQLGLAEKPPRELTGRMMLLIILAFFGVVVGVNVVMARFAVTTFGGVETESSYKAGLAFRSEEEAAAQQATRGWNVEADVESRGEARHVVLIVRDAAGKPLSGLDVTGRLFHPTDARGDVTLVLADIGGGRYTGAVTAHAGQWDLMLDLAQGGQRLFRSKNRVQLH